MRLGFNLVIFHLYLNSITILVSFLNHLYQLFSLLLIFILYLIVLLFDPFIHHRFLLDRLSLELIFVMILCRWSYSKWFSDMISCEFFILVDEWLSHLQIFLLVMINFLKIDRVTILNYPLFECIWVSLLFFLLLLFETKLHVDILSLLRWLGFIELPIGEGDELLSLFFILFYFLHLLFDDLLLFWYDLLLHSLELDFYFGYLHFISLYGLLKCSELPNFTKVLL